MQLSKYACWPCWTAVGCSIFHKDARKKDHPWTLCELHVWCISPRIEKFTIGIQDQLLPGQLVASPPYSSPDVAPPMIISQHNLRVSHISPLRTTAPVAIPKHHISLALLWAHKEFMTIYTSSEINIAPWETWLFPFMISTSIVVEPLLATCGKRWDGKNAEVVLTPTFNEWYFCCMKTII